MINNIRRTISQLSDTALQRKLWLNENNDTGLISSYDEAFSTLFDDNNFDEFVDMEAVKRGISDDLISEFAKLKQQLQTYQQKTNDAEIIKDPEWLKIVNQAKIVTEKWKSDNVLSYLKSEQQILKMLIPELISGVNKLSSINKNPGNYNDLFGNTSLMLTGLLELMLKTKFADWDRSKWFDDSFLSEARFENSVLTLEGVMIWGRENTSQRWVDPFLFEIDLQVNENSYKKYVFLFGHLDDKEIIYEQFNKDRSYWNNREKDWKYIITS